MKQTWKYLALALALCLALSPLSGCAQTAPAQAVPAASETNAGTQSAPQQAEEPAPQPAEPPKPAGREITDMAGRTMVVPDNIESVFSTGATAAIYLYTLVPDKLLGWNYELNDVEKSIILEKYHSIPNFGMGDAINYEAVIAANPSIALNVSAINEKTIDDSDKLAQSLGIPVVMVASDLTDAPEVYRFMGELFGVQEQAEKLAQYAEDTFDDIASMNIPEEQKLRIYYGNGEDSLETAPAGSAHGQIIDRVNALNAADLELGDGSRVKISLEQLLAWDPDVIIVNGEPKADMSGGTAANAIMNDPDFATLTAVKNCKVYGTPNAPFSWIDRPPGPNRIIGLRWLAGLIYPDYLDYDVDEEVREFFSLFYHVELTDEQLAKVYAGEL